MRCPARGRRRSSRASHRGLPNLSSPTRARDRGGAAVSPTQNARMGGQLQECLSILDPPERSLVAASSCRHRRHGRRWLQFGMDRTGSPNSCSHGRCRVPLLASAGGPASRGVCGCGSSRTPSRPCCSSCTGSFRTCIRLAFRGPRPACLLPASWLVVRQRPRCSPPCIWRTRGGNERRHGWCHARSPEAAQVRS
jgi:hypothetical protein